MAKPILLTGDDDADVVRGIVRDLRSNYGAQYRVLASDSPEGALDLLNQLKLRSDNVALLLADQRMPRIDGVQFLRKARTDWLADVVERDDHGFIHTGPDLLWDGARPKGWTLDRDPILLETNIPGLFALGDVRHGSVKRVASGVGEGSVAVQFSHQYLSKV
jgi:thioredoxin reductase